ncbi:MAG: MBL fold metallo-hydrolase [Gammaproteobacteria bacterium]|nr:MBL fold metallo-hydrolase [Gammaproteobacteria bacterium]
MAHAINLKTHKIDATAYALVGELGPRTYENHGLNNTVGFVITPQGVVLIDSGASPMGAAEIAKRVAAVTDKPIKWVINTGSQDHRWLGNSYFKKHGAEIIALKKTVVTQQRFADDHISGLQNTLKDRAKGITPEFASRSIDSDHAQLNLGGTPFEIFWFGDTHFPGDAVVWLPKQRIAFTGDMVYLDRMLGILPYSNVISWQQAFHKMEQLEPKWIVPGHGDVAPLSKVQAETGNYLDFLISGVKRAQEDWLEIDDTVNLLSETESAAPFAHLQNFDSWHRTNINRTFLTLESAE